MLSVIIPHRNEEMLGWTIDNVRRTVGVDHEIITVDDGSDRQPAYPMPEQCISISQPVGNCYARDMGILAAQNDTCVVIDAHMDFWEGWGREVVDWMDSGPRNRIACTVCPQLSYEDREMRQGRGVYHGAYLKWTDISFGRRRSLPNKWGPYEAPCQVGCILGGAYILSRDHYIEIGQPWKYMRGWGHSEQIISLVNWLLGGENWLLPTEIGHVFRTGQFNRVPYRTYTHNIYANQMTVIAACVHDESDAAELRAWIERDIDDQGLRQHVAKTLIGTGIREYSAWVREHAVRTWAEYRAQWIDPYRGAK